MLRYLAIAAAVLIVAVFRFGVLAGVMVSFTMLLRGMPWALDPSAWYGPASLIAPVLLCLLAAWAAKVAVGERASFGSILGE